MKARLAAAAACGIALTLFDPPLVTNAKQPAAIDSVVNARPRA